MTENAPVIIHHDWRKFWDLLFWNGWEWPYNHPTWSEKIYWFTLLNCRECPYKIDNYFFKEFLSKLLKEKSRISRQFEGNSRNFPVFPNFKEFKGQKIKSNSRDFKASSYPVTVTAFQRQKIVKLWLYLVLKLILAYGWQTFLKVDILLVLKYILQDAVGENFRNWIC